MSPTMTLDPITLPAPVARTAPSPWPRPVPTPDEAADLFAVYEFMPNPRYYLKEDWQVPCACLVGALLVGVCGSIARARAAIDDASGRQPACGARLALERAAGWSGAFVTGLDVGFTFESMACARASGCYSRDQHDAADYLRGAEFGAATHQILRNRRMLP
jgi:uncharacterized protein YceK